MSPLSLYFTCLELPAVYNLYQYSTWTLSLSFCVIETSEPEPKELQEISDGLSVGPGLGFFFF